VDTLRSQRDKVRRYSVFGDDNRAQIDAQIRVAEEKFDDEDIDDRIEDALQDAARDMLYWINGDEDLSPSESWAPLCK
jgi:Lon protease-like protein